MKKKIAAVIAALLYAALLCTPALAASRVPEMELDVAMRPDGSAHITQVWLTDADEGTEFYLGCREAVIWQDYMVYALMLGIADKLDEQIQDLYPDQLPQLNQYRHYVRYTGYYNGVMYGAYSREILRRTPNHRSGGNGGRVSFGGGGGFSGGGGGGIR